ncbi:MAG: FAD-dependent oxidoreductase [Bacteroidetes bacterium]|jgi:pyruvate/2-oxoglutarate dehydrogenase complex dihydrolipoamide dehydrogenase (E3) component|nr:FAD-dependent oxidoreductase [Bacteroidota bacterium]
MTNPTTASSFDLLVIGAGQGGGPLAGKAAEAGWRVALVERAHVGGTCVNEGCTPTKTMIASARVAHLARRAADYGVHTSPVAVDLATVRQRKRDIVESFRAGSKDGLTSKEHLSLIMGEASFTGPDTVEVALNDGGTRTLTADRIVVNTGTRPFIPPIEGLADVNYLTNASIMELAAVPDHLVVLGGGYIGLEFGQMFHRFGSEVTIVQRGDQLLSREDADVGDAIAAILRAEGLTVHLGTEASAVTQAADGTITVTATQHGDTVTLTGSHVLVATGRRPNTDALSLEAAGLTTDDRGFLPVNERLETDVEGIYAIGDVKGGPAFTHISYDDFRILQANWLEGGDRTTKGRMVPYTVFIDPQLGRIGLSEQQARAAGHDIRVAHLPMTSVARALETDETRGFMKAVVDANTDQLLGATILGVEGGEIASVLQVAMMGNVPYTALRDGVFSHPTYTESLNNLFMAMEA